MDIKEDTPIDPAPAVELPVSPVPPPKVATVADVPFHVHHAIVGAVIAGASLLALFITDLKPTTRYAIAGLGVTAGAVLVYDDLVQHSESGCDFSTIINFVPCDARLKTVKKPVSVGEAAVKVIPR